MAPTPIGAMAPTQSIAMTAIAATRNTTARRRNTRNLLTKPPPTKNPPTKNPPTKPQPTKPQLRSHMVGTETTERIVRIDNSSCAFLSAILSF